MQPKYSLCNILVYLVWIYFRLFFIEKNKKVLSEKKCNLKVLEVI